MFQTGSVHITSTTNCHEIENDYYEIIVFIKRSNRLMLALV